MITICLVVLEEGYLYCNEHCVSYFKDFTQNSPVELPEMLSLVAQLANIPNVLESRAFWSFKVYIDSH